jgi:hypothetical protein
LFFYLVQPSTGGQPASGGGQPASGGGQPWVDGGQPGTGSGRTDTGTQTGNLLFLVDHFLTVNTRPSCASRQFRKLEKKLKCTKHLDISGQPRPGGGQPWTGGGQPWSGGGQPQGGRTDTGSQTGNLIFLVSILNC